MKLRFLQTTPSSNPDFPFQPGQTIELARLTADLRKWIKHGHAEVVRDDSTETAVAPKGEKAVLR